MNCLLKRALSALLALALLSLPLAAARAQATAGAQAFKPVAVVSLASIKENLNDIGYVTRVAGMADQGDTARFLASAMASGIDKERPIGMYFVPNRRDVGPQEACPWSPGTVILVPRKRDTGPQNRRGRLACRSQKTSVARPYHFL